MRRARLDAVGARLEQLHRVGLRERALRLRHARADPVARQAAAHEHDEALGAGHARAAVGERVDLELELVAALRARHPSFDSIAFSTVLRFALRRS